MVIVVDKFLMLILAIVKVDVVVLALVVVSDGIWDGGSSGCGGDDGSKSNDFISSNLR